MADFSVMIIRSQMSYKRLYLFVFVYLAKAMCKWIRAVYQRSRLIQLYIYMKLQIYKWIPDIG